MTDHLRVIQGGAAKPYYEVVQSNEDDGGGFCIVHDRGEIIMALTGDAIPRATHVTTMVTPPLDDREIADAFCAALNARHEKDEQLYGD